MMTLVQKLAADIDAACKAPSAMVPASTPAFGAQRLQASFTKELHGLLERFKVQVAAAGMCCMFHGRQCLCAVCCVCWHTAACAMTGVHANCAGRNDGACDVLPANL
jgi:hypothetical protein